jgi:hypothetical protein
MKGVVALLFLFPACYLVLSADFPVTVTASLIADVQAHFYASCVYILHSSVVYGKLIEILPLSFVTMS